MGGTGRETVLSESRWLRAFTERLMDITKGLEVIDGRKRSRKKNGKNRKGNGSVWVEVVVGLSGKVRGCYKVMARCKWQNVVETTQKNEKNRRRGTVLCALRWW